VRFCSASKEIAKLAKFLNFILLPKQVINHPFPHRRILNRKGNKLSPPISFYLFKPDRTMDFKMLLTRGRGDENHFVYL
jgi:hypothetical protein